MQFNFTGLHWLASAAGAVGAAASYFGVHEPAAAVLTHTIAAIAGTVVLACGLLSGKAVQGSGGAS